MRAKRIMAAVLAAAMVMGSSLSVFAAGSPTAGNSVGYKDNNSQDHNNNVVVATITETGATVEKIESTKAGSGKSVEVEVARNADGSTTDIDVIGDGKNGVFNTKAGQRVKTLAITSAASKVVVKKNAFKGSKIKTIKIKSQKVVLNSKAFNGTKGKTVTLKFVKTKANSLVVKKNALKGVSTIKIKGLNKAQKKALTKKLRKAKFKGTIK